MVKKAASSIDSAVTGFVEQRFSINSDNFRKGYRVLIGIIYVQLAVIVVLAYWYLHLVSQGFVPDNNYAETIEGQKISMQALKEPSYSQSSILEWATLATNNVLTFGFHNVDESLTYAMRAFTPVGWESFLKAFLATKLIERVTQAQLLLTAIPYETPTILSEGFEEDKYAWVVKLPMLITARAGKQKATARVTVNLTIVKVPTSIDPKGLGIERWLE